MQPDAGEVGWTPVSIEYQLPWESRLFLLYLLFVLIIVAWKCLKLVCNLWSFSTKKRQALLQTSTGAEKAKLIAQFALASNFWRVFDTQKTSDFTILKEAESTFFRLFEAWSGTTTSIMRVGALTALLAVTAFAIRATDALVIITSQKTFSTAATSGGLAEAFMLLALGLVCSTLFYVAYLFFDGALRKRKLVWDRIWRGTVESLDLKNQQRAAQHLQT